MKPTVRHTVETFLDQLKEEFDVANGEKLQGEYPSLTVCGMGGSGVVGDFLNVLYPDRNVSIHKNYGLPSHAGMKGYRRPNTFYLILSYSGDTVETLSSFDVAVEEGLPIAVVTGGGKLLERAQKAGVPHIHIPHVDGIPARFAVGYLLNASLRLLSAVQTTDTPSQCFAPLDSEFKANQEDAGRELAQKLAERTILVYTEPTLEALGLFWKEMLNETAKMPAFNNLIPEANHNELESISAISKPSILVLHDTSADKRIEIQLQALEEIAKKQGWGYEQVNLTENHLISQLMNGVVRSYWVGLTLAELKGVDPSQTPLINSIKSHLS